MNNIYIIVAMTEKSCAIGGNGDLLYHIPEDLVYFKEKTLGHTIVVGYNTYMSFPRRPLPKRKNIVITRKHRDLEDVETKGSKEEILEYAAKNPDETIFICGGDQIYRQFIDDASKLYITYIQEDSEIDCCEAWFPEPDYDVWKVVSETHGKNIPENVPPYRFVVLERR